MRSVDRYRNRVFVFVFVCLFVCVCVCARACHSVGATRSRSQLAFGTAAARLSRAATMAELGSFATMSTRLMMVLVTMACIVSLVPSAHAAIQG